MKTINFDVNSWEGRFILEAFRALHEQWLTAAHTTTDEDEQADYSNDLGQLENLQRRFEQDACEAFGPQVKTFSRKPVCSPKV